MQAIIVDLDNVISETDIKIRGIIRKKYGVCSKRRDVIEFNYEDCLPITKDQAQEVLKEFHRYHLLSLRVVPGAKQALKTIQKYFKIIIATERPVHTKEDTTRWIHSKNLSNEAVLFVTDKNELLNLGASWFIDDRWENAVKIANRGVRVILFDYPWNRKGTHKLILRANGWSEIVDILGIKLN